MRGKEVYATIFFESVVGYLERLNFTCAEENSITLVDGAMKLCNF